MAPRSDAFVTYKNYRTVARVITRPAAVKVRPAGQGCRIKSCDVVACLIKSEYSFIVSAPLTLALTRFGERNRVYRQ